MALGSVKKGEFQPRPMGGQSTRLRRIAVFVATQATYEQWGACIRNTLALVPEDARPDFVEERDPTGVFVNLMLLVRASEDALRHPEF